MLLIGWGSADWKVIDPLIEAGALPNLQKLLKEGTKASLGGFDPPILPAAWTTLATSRTVTNHGVHSFTKVKEDAVVPISSNDRKAKALWNVLSDYDLKTHQIGFWGSYPAAPINGISVTDIYPYFDKNTLPEQAVFPNNQKDRFANLLVAPSQITDAQLNSFISAELSSDEYEEYLEKIKVFIASVNSIQAATKDILQNEEWDCVSVFYNRLSNLTFQFMPFHIDENPDVSQELKNAFSQVLGNAYKYLDTLLGELLELAGEELTVMLVSQGGYLPDKLWIDKLNRPDSTWEYNSPGIFLLKRHKETKGNQREAIYGISSLDIAGTILGFFGIPISRKLEGKLLIPSQRFDQEKDFIDGYEDQPKTETIPLENSAEILNQQLTDLGYLIDSVENIKELNEYHHIRGELSAGKHTEVYFALKKIRNRNKHNSWYGGRLAGCYLAKNQPDRAKELLDEVLSFGEKIPELHLLKSQMLLAEKKFRSAVKEFDIAEKNIGKIAGLYSQIGEGYLVMDQWIEAAKRFKMELEHNPHPAVYSGLAAVYLQNKRTQKAIEPLKKTIELVPRQSTSYLHLANALYQLKEYEEAAEVMEEGKKHIKDAKSAQQAQQLLYRLYKNHLNRPDKIQEMQEAFEKSIGSRGTITVVSGLPRSGTSMMMQMLHRGGLEPFTDGLRKADENNKKGYYEHEAVKNLAQNKQFLSQVGDKFVKIISHLLSHLPHVYKYKIIFMDRSIEEVMTSQHKMLGRLDKERGKDIANSMSLMKTFKESREKTIQWCKDPLRSKFVDLLIVPYSETIANPMEQAKRVNEFLGGTLDVDKMASVADKALYREKAKDTTKV